MLETTTIIDDEKKEEKKRSRSRSILPKRKMRMTRSKTALKNQMKLEAMLQKEKDLALRQAFVYLQYDN